MHIATEGVYQGVWVHGGYYASSSRLRESGVKRFRVSSLQKPFVSTARYPELIAGSGSLDLPRCSVFL
jgi:hypothetical protein